MIMDRTVLAELDAVLNRQWSRTISLSNSTSTTTESSSNSSTNSSIQQYVSINMSELVLREVIGVGAIGKVHRGLYKGQEVAIKLLDGSSGSDGVSDWRRLSLMKELKIWRRLDHPNIVKLIGASPGVVDKAAPSSCCCIVSEFMPNGTLGDYLATFKRSSSSLATVLRLALDVARGVEYLHSKNILHRDIKTGNILLDSCLRAKIGDFDSARIEAEDLRDMSGEIGTLGYMAPEVCGSRPYDRRSDVFSYGVCLLEIYCSCCCSSGDSLTCVNLTKVFPATKLAAPRVRIPKSCPSELATIIRRCCKREPSKRPTMAEVVSALEAIVSRLKTELN